MTSIRLVGVVISIGVLVTTASALGKPAGTGDSARALSKSSSDDGFEAQAVRTCVDRWNQGSMLSWGPALVDISFRTLDRARLAEVGLHDAHARRCVALFAFEYPRDPSNGCGRATVASGRPGYCVDRSGTFFCVIDRYGAYACPPRHEPLRTAPLRKANAVTNRRGVLTLNTPLDGTRPTPPLAWQRLYPHTDGLSRLVGVPRTCSSKFPTLVGR